MSVPKYDLTMDEMSMALSYVSMTDLTIPAAAAAPAAKKDAKKEQKQAKKKEEPKKATKKDDDDDDDFDVFGDDGDDGEEEPKETRAEMLARLKKEAEERTKKKEAKQRTIVCIEVKPWDTEQDLMALFKKITSTVTQDGLKWAEHCQLQEVAFGIKKIVTTFTMGANNSSDDVVEAIQGMEDEVQSVEVMSMNVL